MVRFECKASFMNEFKGFFLPPKLYPMPLFSIWLYPFANSQHIRNHFYWVVSLCNITTPKPKCLASLAKIISFFALDSSLSFIFLKSTLDIQYSCSTTNFFFTNLSRRTLNTYIFGIELQQYLASLKNIYRLDTFVRTGMFL